MLSFVVQNFLLPKVFLIKTQRYNFLIKNLSVELLFIFFKIVNNFFKYYQYFNILNPYTLYFFKKQYIFGFWKTFKSLYFKKMGLNSSNLTKSLMFSSISKLNNVITLDKVKLDKINLIKLNNIYVKPVQILTFSFHKNIYNSFMFFLFYLFSYSYISNFSNFKLYYSFINFSPNFNIYMFINVFYFKVRNF